MKLKLFEDFHKETPVADSGIVTMYNLKDDNIKQLTAIGATVTKDDETSTDQDDVFSVEFKTKEVAEDILEWILSVEEDLPFGDIVHLYPGLFGEEEPMHEDDQAAMLKQVWPDMVNVSNNSKLTQSVAMILAEKLTSKELNDFRIWIKLVSNTSSLKQNKSRF